MTSDNVNKPCPRLLHSLQIQPLLLYFVFILWQQVLSVLLNPTTTFIGFRVLRVLTVKQSTSKYSTNTICPSSFPCSWSSFGHSRTLTMSKLHELWLLFTCLKGSLSLCSAPPWSQIEQKAIFEWEFYSMHAMVVVRKTMEMSFLHGNNHYIWKCDLTTERYL